MPILRPANLFLLFTYLTLSAVPFLPFLWGKSVANWLPILEVELALWLIVWAVFKRPAYFHWALLPAFVALPVEIYLQIYYGQGISTHHIGIIFETSPNETIEFLGNKIWLLLALAVLIVIWFILSWVAAARSRALDLPLRARAMIVALALFGVGVWQYGENFGVVAAASASSSASAASSTSVASASEGEEEEEECQEGEECEEGEIASASEEDLASVMPKLPNWAQPKVEFADLAHSWPFGLAARAVDFVDERKHLAELSQKNSHFKFDAKLRNVITTPQVVVMVIGESSRYDRWSLNGYERETNPLLKKIPNLVSLPDVITSVSATRLSVPVILSRKTAMQSLKDGFSEKSFITAYKEAGFKTWWLSNQISFGQYDTPISVFAKESDVIQFMNLGGFTNESNFDQILLGPYQAALADPAPKKLIVLHTLGSHWNYSHRHPKEFDKWKPSLFGVDKPAYTDLKNKPLLSNSYDNSILYTDWFLAQVIGQLQGSDKLTSMMYVADHGQTLYDGSCRLAFHGHNTQYEFHVPALVWYSDQYKTAFPDKIHRLKRNTKARLATENMFHTLLDMGDIAYPDERLERSFLSKKFKHHKRYVDSFGWTNYDNAIIKGDCREVIDKGKPLAQEK